MRRAWQAGQLEPLASHDTIAELIRALAYPKFRLAADHRLELLGDYLPCCRTVDVRGRSRSAPVCGDPKDQMLIDLAFAGNARWLVTGDRALLGLSAQAGNRIVTPREFLARLSAR